MVAEPRRLSLVLERASEDVHEPDFIPDAPLVSFEAYVADHRLFGWVRLDADRLTDLLNTHEELHLVNVLLERPDAAGPIGMEEALVRRGELVAVRASGPRGDAGRWRATVPHPVIVTAGRYRIGGHLHAAPGEEPGARANVEGPMLPLTDAWVEIDDGARVRRRAVGTVIVNRDLATRIEAVAEVDLRAVPPGVGVESGILAT